MNRCTRCQTELAEGALFCPHCGERVAAPSTPALAPEIVATRDAMRDATRVLQERAAELTPDRITELARTAQAGLADQIATLSTGVETRFGALEQSLLELRRLPTAGGPAGDNAERTHGFRDFAEFIRALVYTRGTDRRLRPALPVPGAVAPDGQRDLSMTVGAAGGFLIPPQFADMITAITPQDAIVRPRATVFPAGDFPDAALTMPMMNQSGALGVFAGMTGAWVAEGGLKPETQPTVAQITLTPHEVAAFVDVTDQLLRNNPAAVQALLQTGFRDVILAMEDNGFITGTGVGQPLGFLGHASNVNVIRAGGAGTATFVYADVVNLYARMLKAGTAGPVWLVSPSVLPLLMSMVSPGAVTIPVWQPSLREGMPSTMLGYPVIVNERQPVLGTAGDVMLVNLRYYAIKEGVGLSIRDDQGIGQFANNITRIKAFRSVDGQPMLATPLLLEDAVTTVSPFVVLN